MRALTKLKKIMLVAVVLALPSSFVAAGDAVKGAKVYKKSKAMVKYAATAKIWSEENLAAYLESPRKLVKGGRMAFAGLRKEKDRANIIAYLKENAK
jgi:cytochrome c